MRVGALYVRMLRGRERTAEALGRAYRGRPAPQPAKVTSGLRKVAAIAETQVDGHRVFTATPIANRSDWHIVYTHGGSFVNPLLAPHWDVITELVKATRATVTVPLYPLAPEHTHGVAHAFLEKIYRELPAGRVVLCGDSAGGNLALVQALRYRDLGLPPPARVILFSPWVELTMKNPDIAAVQPRDPMLWVSELAECGKWWAGDADPTGPLLSPVNANLEGLPPIEIHQGTDDVLAPDARLLRDRLAAAGGKVEYHEVANAFHDFMAATITPEARTVYATIARSLAIVALVMVAACSGSQKPAGAANEPRCKIDPAARTACEAKGSGYLYGTEPDFGCTGTDVGPEGRAEIEKAEREHPCACMSPADQSAARERCMTMP